MKKKGWWCVIVAIAILILVYFCVSLFMSKSLSKEGNSQLANPASVYCEEQGGVLDIRSSNETGDQTGICIKNGKECEEWALYRGECSF